MTEFLKPSSVIAYLMLLGAAVLCWLATSPAAPAFQRRTIQAQPFAIEQGIVPDWRAPAAVSA